MSTKQSKSKSNSNLHAAKKAKNDEFYTQLADVENEMKHYRRHLRGKVVLCNCDDPEWSQIFRYFALNFSFLGLKKLVSTHYSQDGSPSYKLEITGDMNGDGRVDEGDIVKTTLSGDGDFRSEECLEILRESDVVVTNPPFSLFREFVSLIESEGKKMIVMCTLNAITYKEIFPLIQADKLWLGVNNSGHEFQVPDSAKKFSRVDDDGVKYVKLGNTCWYTNLNHKRRKEGVTLFRRKKDLDYPHYDNYKAIEVSKTADIPRDYKGIMGVPITFLTKYNPEQFEILGSQRWAKTAPLVRAYTGGKTAETDMKTTINGTETYDRIFIRRKK